MWDQECHRSFRLSCKDVWQKINLQNENEAIATHGNDTSTENEHTNDKNEVAHYADASQKEGKKKEVSAQKLSVNHQLVDNILTNPLKYVVTDVPDDEMTEFQRRNAMFNKNKHKYKMLGNP